MGFFNKTEEEIERKKLKDLKDIIRSSNNMDSLTKEKLTKVVDEVINGGKNIFFDNDLLASIILDMTSEYSKITLEGMVRCIRDIFPYGSETNSFKVRKELFVNNFLGEYGYINKEIYDYSIFSSFNNIDNFIRVMNSISNNSIAIEHFTELKNYINKSSKYAIDEETFTISLISTINKLDEAVLDIKNYLNDELEEDKKRVGIYSISHDDILEATSSMSRIESEIDKANSLVETIKEEGLRVRKSADDGINSIKKSKEEIIRELNSYKASLEKELKSILESYLENVKIDINNKADTVFAEILDKYQNQLEEIRKVSKNISQANARELTILKAETDKSLSQLREYVDNNSELHMYIDRLEKSGEIKDKLIDLIEKEKDSLGSVASQKTNVQGIERIVVPENPGVVLPSSITIPENVQIIPSYVFQNAKEYKKILESIKDKLQGRERRGEIFHNKVLEVIECLLVGDWPYMYGPSGAGKGYMINQIGELIGQKVIDGGKIGEVHTVLGYIDAQGRFRATPAVEACVNGGLIFFDEFDNSNSDTRVALNTMYSNLREKIINPKSKQYIRFAGEIDIPINPNMRMIAAGNTDGTGSTGLWTDRYPTDESIQERYKPIYIEYDPRVEKSILSEYDEWYDFFVKFRNACTSYAHSQDEQEAAGITTTRDASDIKRDVKLDAKTLDQMITQYFVQIKDDEYRNALAREIIHDYEEEGLDVSVDETYGDYTGELADASREDIAKQFIKRCKTGIR